MMRKTVILIAILFSLAFGEKTLAEQERVVEERVDMRKNEDCEENCKKYELAKNGKIIPEYLKRCVEAMCDGSSRVDMRKNEDCEENCKAYELAKNGKNIPEYVKRCISLYC